MRYQRDVSAEAETEAETEGHSADFTNMRNWLQSGPKVSISYTGKTFTHLCICVLSKQCILPFSTWLAAFSQIFDQIAPKRKKDTYRHTHTSISFVAFHDDIMN